MLVCLFNEDCEFRDKNRFCLFGESCNQQGKPYVFTDSQGKQNIELLRQSDITLIEGLKEYLIKNPL